MGGMKKNRDFSITISLYLGNDTIYDHSYNGRPIGTRMQSICRYRGISHWCRNDVSNMHKSY